MFKIMNNQKYSIAIAAVLFAAALAGVMFICDEDVVAAESEVQTGEGASTPATGAGEGEFTVTYAYDGSSIVKKMDDGNKVTFANALSFSAPTGYAFEKDNDSKMVWKDASSGAKYVEGQTYSFSANIVVEPIVKIAQNYATITLTDGVNARTFLVEKTEIAAPAESDAELVIKYMLNPEDTDLTSYLASIGLKIADADKIEINKEGFIFDGFFKDASVTGLFQVSELVGVEQKDTIYSAKFTPVYKISFNVEGAQTADVESNTIVTDTNGDVKGLPVAPVKENYIFMGWYNATGEKVFGYSADRVAYTYADKDFKFTEDTALFAKFVPLTYTVTFVYGEDAKVFETETVKYGEKAIEPKALPAGYKGWDFDFKNPILADTTIVAVEADPVTVYNVVFEIEGKAPITQKSDSMVLPDTTREGYVFQGWLVKGETGYVDPMKYDIQSDITFVAVYKQADPPAGPGFFETNEGKCVAVIIGVALLAFVYAVYTNMFGMKDFLTSIKIQRVKKE